MNWSLLFKWAAGFLIIRFVILRWYLLACTSWTASASWNSANLSLRFVTDVLLAYKFQTRRVNPFYLLTPTRFLPNQLQFFNVFQIVDQMRNIDLVLILLWMSHCSPSFVYSYYLRFVTISTMSVICWWWNQVMMEFTTTFSSGRCWLQTRGSWWR